jgi:hypothetical protein
MMRRVGPKEDKGPPFFAVWEDRPGIWETRAFWFASDANRWARFQAGFDKLAFVEMR